MQRLIDNRMNMITPAWVRVDHDDPNLDEYLSIRLPHLWSMTVGPRLPLSEVYNEAFATYKRDWYGFIADDVVPLTEDWDVKLIAAAGRDGMAVPSGSDSTGPCPHFVLGRELPDLMGWLCLPGLSRLFIDTVWYDIAKGRQVYRPVPEVILSHYHFSNHRALFDETYKKPSAFADKNVYQAWRETIVV